ncbi:hypothetical protein DPMN_083534 [Dreissena polymorpha]|uniref:Uncharacterized protein n=1 Tax=Dreissena polymorpha TaxID=45954 RepID=A0A9D3YC45_DREPO|nr:hypothetical protein DPMN_083534 [Dreissena polymorpha]
MEFCDKRRKLRHDKYAILDSITEYQTTNRQAKKYWKEVKKKEWIKEKCIKIVKEKTTDSI